MLTLIQLPLLPAAAMLAVVLLVLWRRGGDPSRLFFAFLLGGYLLLVMRGTLFPIPLPRDWQQTFTSNFTWILSQVNLIPFNPEALPVFPRMAFFQLAANVVLTVPFGFGVNFILPVRARWVPLLALLPGLAIETAQLALTLLVGARYRVVDIDDVLMNTAGVLIGYLLFRIFAWLWLALIRLTGARPSGLFGYVDAIVRRTARSGYSPRMADSI